MARLLTNGLFPLFVFLCLAYSAFQLLLRRSLHQSGLSLKISAACLPDLDPPHLLRYTNIPQVDEFLCHLVTFFHVLINTAYYPLLASLFSAVAIVALTPFLEAARDNRAFVLNFPTLVGILYQCCSMGVVMPIYALLFIITGTASTLSPNLFLTINQGNAEALLFGIVVGYVLPTVLMLYLVDPVVTVVWQGFPFIIALAILAHKLIRPPSRHAQSGHPTVLATLIFTFVISALLHIVYVWPVLPDIVALQKFFIPIALSDVLDPEMLSLADSVVEFIKWELIFGTGSVALATLWMADSVRSLFGIVVWYGVATIALGPAAAIAGIFLWRERRLNGRGDRATDKMPEKTE